MKAKMKNGGNINVNENEKVSEMASDNGEWRRNRRKDRQQHGVAAARHGGGNSVAAQYRPLAK